MTASNKNTGKVNKTPGKSISGDIGKVAKTIDNDKDTALAWLKSNAPVSTAKALADLGLAWAKDANANVSLANATERCGMAYMIQHGPAVLDGKTPQGKAFHEDLKAKHIVTANLINDPDEKARFVDRFQSNKGRVLRQVSIWARRTGDERLTADLKAIGVKLEETYDSNRGRKGAGGNHGNSLWSERMGRTLTELAQSLGTCDEAKIGPAGFDFDGMMKAFVAFGAFFKINPETIAEKAEASKAAKADARAAKKAKK